MEHNIAFCGLDCEACDAYLATIRDDQALREKTARLWAELNQAPILPEHINCTGCRGGGVKTIFCQQLCAIRRCALQRGVPSCGRCPELERCAELGRFFQQNPQARQNLENERRGAPPAGGREG